MNGEINLSLSINVGDKNMLSDYLFVTSLGVNGQINKYVVWVITIH